MELERIAQEIKRRIERKLGVEPYIVMKYYRRGKIARGQFSAVAGTVFHGHFTAYLTEDNRVRLVKLWITDNPRNNKQSKFFIPL